MLAGSVGRDPCGIANRWTLSPTLADMLVRLEEWAHTEFAIPGRSLWPGLFIISGYRSPSHNREVGGAPNSFHTVCPSMAVDLRVGSVAGLGSDEVWAILGGKWRLMGGAWGGSFSTPDPNHFDIGGVG